MPGQFDNETLANQTFYRGVASPAVAGKYGYIGIYNPTGSGVQTWIDNFGLWPGLPNVAGELGIVHYNTPFNKVPGFTYTGTVPFAPCLIGGNKSKTQIWLGAYAGILNPFVDYVTVGPNNTTPERLDNPPYPLLINEGDGIVFWNPTMGYELKLQIWIREL